MRASEPATDATTATDAAPDSAAPPGERGSARTRDRILDEAERLAQVRGFNGFSYADIAAELGVTKAALHYHFASKAELGRALVARYSERFARALASIDASASSAPAKLHAYAGLYGAVLREGRMCLCGMLAAEHETLPAPIRAAVVSFLDDNEAWLRGVLRTGREQGSLRFDGSATDAARGIVSGLEGAMLVARSYGDVQRFESGAVRLLAGLAGTAERS